MVLRSIWSHRLQPHFILAGSKQRPVAFVMGNAYASQRRAHLAFDGDVISQWLPRPSQLLDSPVELRQAAAEMERH